MYKIGIDVGGTNTDAVVLDKQNHVIAEVKSSTTEDVESGIYQALEKILEVSQVDPKDIDTVMLGTTHATNAIIERSRLTKIACVRICLPAGTAVEPMFTWDESLKKAAGDTYYFVHGGCETDGRPLAGEHLDYQECADILSKIKESDVQSLAVTAVFSPVLDTYEKEFQKIAYDVLGEEFPVTISSEIGSMGLLERENSAALNAALVNVAKAVSDGLEQSLLKYGINARIYFAQNDGTLMEMEHAKKYPILTIGSGPTNSIRGAAELSGLKDCIICDIGGTTTDIGILVNGFPRESSVAVTIGGVKTNFRMPDIVSIGIGGGSIVRFDDGNVTVGPDSVGYRITEDAIAFGGDVLTATDCLLATGRVHIEHPNINLDRLKTIPQSVLDQAVSTITAQVEMAIDKIKTSAGSVPVVLVGGGSILIPGDIEGASEVIRPKHAGCANALGAAIAQVSGDIDKMYSMAGVSREKVLQQASKEAKDKAIAGGALAETVEIIDLEVLPMAYVTSEFVRIKAKAAGKMNI
ncbi:hydantoinase/oxoprolinase family protein [Terrilactibacillus sp. BCM23-1]|uniref:Hydantoinase/oxoprolinase family protein n=1 Tax=Terrilactibacillus tamarindi TaxID=2599694 RepID=A0A6N8CPT8_9BACI|nr:hydantoinase/oxoprolinase family protein [Terrilactibacillus tamarindi]MTT32194.1 hydantoinase/oxoprolinase family protein [Terrilactibacillus tamarindi]